MSTSVNKEMWVKLRALGGNGGGNRGVCVQGRVYWGKACASCARHGFRGFPELFVLPHSRARAGTRTVGLVRHGTCLRRVQGCGIGESVNLDNLGLEDKFAVIWAYRDKT